MAVYVLHIAHYYIDTCIMYIIRRHRTVHRAYNIYNNMVICTMYIYILYLPCQIRSNIFLTRAKYEFGALLSLVIIPDSAEYKIYTIMYY